MAYRISAVTGKGSAVSVIVETAEAALAKIANIARTASPPSRYGTSRARRSIQIYCSGGREPEALAGLGC